MRKEESYLRGRGQIAVEELEVLIRDESASLTEIRIFEHFLVPFKLHS